MNPPKSPPHWTLIACAVFGLFLGYAILTQRCLYADGSFCLIEVLKKGGFAAIVDCRSFSCYAFQWPVVLALKLGVTNIHWLAFAFGIGCFSVWPIAMFLCYRMAPQHFWLVVLACAAGYLNTAFMAVGEHIVAHAFFWPTLFAILFVRPLTPFAAVALIGSTCVLMRSYESMLFLGPLLIALLVWRMVNDKENPRYLAAMAIAGVSLVVSVLVACEGIRHPNVANYHGFFNGISKELKHPEWTLQLTALLILVMFGALNPAVAKFLRRKIGLVLMGLVVLVWGLWPVIRPEQLDPEAQYDCRFLDLLVPLALLPVAVMLAVRSKWLAAQIPDLARLAAIVLFAQSLWHATATYEWQKYVRDCKNILTAGNNGPVFLVGFGNFNQPDMSWANPSVSLMIGPSRVQAMIMPAHPEDWQPFDPFKPSTFPDLKRYGVDYTDYINTLKQRGMAR